MESTEWPEDNSIDFVEVPVQEPAMENPSEKNEVVSKTKYLVVCVIAIMALIPLGYFLMSHYKATAEAPLVAADVPQVNRIETAPPIAAEDLAKIPGEKRQEYEATCVGQAMDKAKELGVEVNAFFKLNQNYVNHCVVRLAKDGAIQ